MVAVLADTTKVLRSRDDGLTWETVVGDRLERMLAREVVYYQYTRDEPGAFIVGTNNGVWRYTPQTEEVRSFFTGMPSGDRDILDLAAPRPTSSGPLVALTRKGNVYLRYGEAETWTKVLETGSDPAPGYATVELFWHYSRNGEDGARKTIAAGIQGQLWVTADGGDNWYIHPQFNQKAFGDTDWTIRSIAFDHSFKTTGIALVGRGRKLTSGPSLQDEGELWRSSWQGSGAFTRVLTMDTAVQSLVATPAGPSGESYLFAAGNRFPNEGVFRNVGIMRSRDGGLTWQDFGNHQDFIVERGFGNNTGEPLATRIEQAFTFSPNFARDGMLLYGRAEGLFQTWNAGRDWREKRIRATMQTRDISATLDAFGNLAVFGATYGSSTLVHDGDTGAGLVLDTECPVSFQKALALSPNFDEDGTFAIAGHRELVLWQDPRLPLQNPRGGLGWRTLPLLVPQLNERVDAYAREVVFSPNYNGSQGSNGDKTFYWTAWEVPPMRTRDNGDTVEVLNRRTDGGQLPFLKQLEIAPTYNDNSASGRTDVYAIAENWLFRLEDREWRPLWQSNADIDTFAIDPSYSRPGNPRLYLVLEADPWIVEVIDLNSGPVIIEHPADIDALEVTDMVLPPNFQSRPVMYVSTWGEGVLKLDFRASTLQFESVGADFPSWGTNSLTCSPNFAVDKRLFVGTTRGFVIGFDKPNQAWLPISDIANRDDLDHGIATFAPNDPNNPQPERPWLWAETITSSINPNLHSTLRKVQVALYDGSYLITNGLASKVTLQTVAATNQGKVLLSAWDYYSGQLVAQKVVDLATVSGSATNYYIDLNLPNEMPIRFRLDVQLDEGESFVYDGLTFHL